MQHAVYVGMFYFSSILGVFIARHLLLLTYRKVAPYMIENFRSHYRKNRKQFYIEYFVPFVNTLAVALYLVVISIILTEVIGDRKRVRDPNAKDEHDPYHHWQ